LITELGQISQLRVISRTSAMTYKGVRRSLPQIARELNVDAVVESTVLRSENQVRITAQLIQAAADKHLWAQSYEGDLRDTLVIQKQVARSIAQAIRIELTPQEQAVLKNVKQVNPDAYEDYLRYSARTQNRDSYGAIPPGQNSFPTPLSGCRPLATHSYHHYYRCGLSTSCFEEPTGGNFVAVRQRLAAVLRSGGRPYNRSRVEAVGFGISAGTANHASIRTFPARVKEFLEGCEWIRHERE
jgi:hypothetical protein